MSAAVSRPRAGGAGAKGGRSANCPTGRSPSFLPPLPQRGNAKRPGNRQSGRPFPPVPPFFVRGETERRRGGSALGVGGAGSRQLGGTGGPRSEEHTAELQSLMRRQYAVLVMKKKHNR